MNNFTNEEILDILKSSKSQKEAILRLNYKLNGSGFRYINKICKLLDYDIKYVTYCESKSDYIINPKICKQCESVIKWDKRQNNFCSHSCAASYNNLGVNRNEITNIYYLECQNCGEKYKNKKRNKYCNNKCQNESEYKKYILDWDAGVVDGRIGLSQVSAYVRKYLFIKNNNKCGWGEYNETTSKIPLEIHHIDGNCINNDKTNLELLCPNCHSLTNNFGSLNKNSKREYKQKKKKSDI